MKAIILCGGKGTRLREETEFRPKPMVEIGGRPILWHIMKLYSYYGFNDFVLCLGYKGAMIKEYFLNYHSMVNDCAVTVGQQTRPSVRFLNEADDHFTVTLADTGAETMTGGRLKRVERYIADDTFMLTYGDGVADVNIRELLAFHHAHGRLATVTAIQPPSRFGLLDISADGAVERFREKPVTDEWINGGFFVFKKEVFDFLDGPQTILEQQPLKTLAAKRQLSVYRHTGFWQCMDTYRESELLNALWASGKAPWKVWS